MGLVPLTSPAELEAREIELFVPEFGQSQLPIALRLQIRESKGHA